MRIFVGGGLSRRATVFEQGTKDDGDGDKTILSSKGRWKMGKFGTGCG